MGGMALRQAETGISCFVERSLVVKSVFRGVSQIPPDSMLAEAIPCSTIKCG
jgi:hypothetical protein